MGMTSAAEAKLDARVRPQIRAMRTRTSYPYPRPADHDTPQQGMPELSTSSTPSARLRVVPSSDAGSRLGSDRSAAPRSASAPGPRPIRLTRRGRIVVGTLIALGVAAAAGAIWLAASGQAQASSQLIPGAPARESLLRVVVRPGQTLWGIATRADPGADPRSVIPQIVELNSLRSTSISPGQVLWVPKG